VFQEVAFTVVDTDKQQEIAASDVSGSIPAIMFHRTSEGWAAAAPVGFEPGNIIKFLPGVKNSSGNWRIVNNRPLLERQSSVSD
jgi:hypothetical protein